MTKPDTKRAIYDAITEMEIDQHEAIQEAIEEDRIIWGDPEDKWAYLEAEAAGLDEIADEITYDPLDYYDDGY